MTLSLAEILCVLGIGASLALALFFWFVSAVIGGRDEAGSCFGRAVAFFLTTVALGLFVLVTQ